MRCHQPSTVPDTKQSPSNSAIVTVIIVDDYYHTLITTLVTFYFQEKKVTLLIPYKLKKRIADLFSHIGCCFILKPDFK